MTKKRTHSVVLDPQTRIDVRIGIADGGEVEWFVVQLLHNLEPYYSEDEDWREIARFDHNPDAQDGHDVVKEGLHMDLTFENRENETVTRFPSHTPPPSYIGLTVRYRINYLRNRHEELTKEYNDDRRRAR